MSVLSAPHLHNEQAAYAHVEARLWPNGPICPHCGGFERISKMGGKSTRIGAYKCYQCRKPFTVKIGTIFEASHVPMRFWLQAIYLYCASKKGFSANQLHRTLGVTLKTAWFMAHRLREAMADDGDEPMGGWGKIVEADETFIGPPQDVFVNGRGWQKRRGTITKRKVISLVERGSRARSFHVESIDAKTVRKVLFENIVQPTRLMTDEAHHYRIPGRFFGSHERVNHSKEEYALGDVTTNTVEGFFSIFKRGMRGIYQHCAEKHLHSYLAELDFRYSNRIALGIDDGARADQLLAGVVGKRLTYRTAVGQA
jgi:transposase-like protein